MAFVYDRETFSLVDEERGITIKPGAGRVDFGECRYHIFVDDCEYVRNTWERELDIFYKFGAEKGPDGRRSTTVTLGENPRYHLRTSTLKQVQGSQPWNDYLEAIFKEAMYYKLGRSVGEENLERIRVSFNNGFERGAPRYVPTKQSPKQV